MIYTLASRLAGWSKVGDPELLRLSSARISADIGRPSPLLTDASALSEGCRLPVSRNEMNRTDTSARSASSSCVRPACSRRSRRTSANAAMRAELLRSMARGIPHTLTLGHEQLFLLAPYSSIQGVGAEHRIA